MRLPPFHRYRRFSQIAAVFVLGVIVGAALYNAIYHMGYNILWVNNHDLRLEIEQYRKDILTLKKYNNTSTVIREIKVRTEESKVKDGAAALDPVTTKEVLSKLAGDLEPLRGAACSISIPTASWRACCWTAKSIWPARRNTPSKSAPCW